MKRQMLSVGARPAVIGKPTKVYAALYSCLGLAHVPNVVCVCVCVCVCAGAQDQPC